MKIVYDPGQRRHLPRTEILYGKPIAHPDRPERVETIAAALADSRWAGYVVPPRAYPLNRATRVHDPAYVAFLVTRELEEGAADPDDEWFPYTWPAHRSLDTGTPLLGITREVAWASACVALTAADLVLEGEPAAYALCRPPGHHASRGTMGGYCYFNNAALAADRLLDRAGEDLLQRISNGEPSAPVLHELAALRVAILDLDIHHGNGTQDIFYSDDRALYCSIHLDPEDGYPPHSGFPDEIGSGPGEGFTFNQLLPKGTDWSAYQRGLDRALDRISAVGARFLVLSQGFDTFEGDRWGGFLLRAEHFTRIGERLRALRLPIVVVLEGGYEPANLAAGSLALLEGLSG